MNVIVAPIRVLLVEPHADTRELYHLGLTAAGFDVRTADDAASASVALVSHAPTIVVSAMRLAGWSDLLTGFAAAGVPVIALTTDALDHQAVIGPAVAAVLMKPCLPDEVATAIRQALGMV